MRCPKCGYFSFDDQETCVKCQKQLTDLITELNGTMHTTVAPAFLRIPDRAKETEMEAEPHDDLFANLDEPSVELPETGEEAPRELVVHLDDDEEEDTPSLDAVLLDLSPSTDSTDAEEFPEMPPLDFGALDISDLAPPEKGGEKEEENAPAVELPEEEPALAAMTAPMEAPIAAPPERAESAMTDDELLLQELHLEPPTPRPDVADAVLAGLEDLNIEGLNLDAPASKPGRIYRPSVKTGTALDQFDIDLGDLFPEQKN
ncbi:MAG: hypothetical protein ACOX5Z_08240 [Desulfobulbus sp.]|jgi:hypothetical protein